MKKITFICHQQLDRVAGPNGWTQHPASQAQRDVRSGYRGAREGGVELGGDTHPLLGCRRGNGIWCPHSRCVYPYGSGRELAKALRRHPTKLTNEGVSVATLISVRPKLDLFATCWQRTLATFTELYTIVICNKFGAIASPPVAEVDSTG